MTVYTNDKLRPDLAPLERVSTPRGLVGLALEGLATLWRTADELYTQVENRRGVRALLELDNSLLRDIGVTRDEVRRAANLPLNSRAGEELSRARMRNAGQSR